MELDFSQYQALGETGNDGAAAEKWLAEQAQVGSLSKTSTVFERLPLVTVKDFYCSLY